MLVRVGLNNITRKFAVVSIWGVGCGVCVSLQEYLVLYQVTTGPALFLALPKWSNQEV